MNTADILRGLWRRWYITVPGVLLSIALTFVVWSNVDPAYERTARQLLLPGSTSIPEGGNPYLYIGGLSQAADVVVLALGSNNVLDKVAEEYPDVKVEISRDTSTSSPVIVISVTAKDDSEGEAVLNMLVGETAGILTELQDQESIASDNRISVNTVTVDSQGVVQQKDRMASTAAAGVAGIVITLVLAASVDGLVISRRRRRGSQAGKSRTADNVNTDPEVHRITFGQDEDGDVANESGDREQLSLDEDTLADDEMRKILAAEHVSASARPRSPGAARRDARRQDSD